VEEREESFHGKDRDVPVLEEVAPAVDADSTPHTARGGELGERAAVTALPSRGRLDLHRDGLVGSGPDEVDLQTSARTPVGELR